jgi:hypothetical protein
VGERNLEPSLLTLQTLLTNAVRLSSPVAADSELARRVESLIAPSVHGMLAPERLDVYREQFWLRHLPNLRDDYPTMVWAVGPEAFEKLSIEYLRAFPPRTWDLQRLGAEMPAYAASYAPCQADPLARDAARLDWAFMEAYGAPDAPPFDPRVVVAAPEDAWPSARVGLHPSVRSLALAYPLHDVRAALKEGKAPERPCSQPSQIIVWRDALCSVRACAVDPLAFALLNQLEAGTKLGEACEKVARCESGPGDTATMGERVAAWFQEWTAAGWVSDVTFAA